MRSDTNKAELTTCHSGMHDATQDGIMPCSTQHVAVRQYESAFLGSLTSPEEQEKNGDGTEVEVNGQMPPPPCIPT